MDLVMSEKIETRGRKPLPLEKKAATSNGKGKLLYFAFCSWIKR